MSKINRIFNKVLAGAIALLGFSACSTEDGSGDVPCMYGTPYGTYEVNGIVRDESGEKLDGMRVVSSFGDTAYTKDGKYQIGPSGCFPFNSVGIKAEDPAGAYTTEIKEVKLNYDGTGNPGSWDSGKAEAIADFQLYKAEDKAQ